MAKKTGKDEKSFIKIAKKKNIELEMFSISEDISEKTIEEKFRRCDIVFNSAGEDFAVEAMGKDAWEHLEADLAQGAWLVAISTEAAGWLLHDSCCWELRTARAQVASHHLRYFRTLKAHETLLVFRKPGPRRQRSMAAGPLPVSGDIPLEEALP